ncbi:MAG: penicillin-binding protein 2 [Anaerosomatales bacterium]|nr:penicillin-binding protein 2 [Anaerosomatales bacterium]
MRAKRGRVRRSGRHVFVLAALLVAFAAVAVRLVQIQAVEGRAYAAMAKEQRDLELELPAQRGSIYDREGKPLAVTTAAKTVYAVPREVADKAGTARALAETLGGSEEKYRARLERKSNFVYLARRIPLEQAQALESLALKGVYFQDDTRRVYPGSSLACQLLGFVGVDGEGLSGVEKQYDELLAGKPGKLICEKGLSGVPIPGGVTYREEPTDGQNVVLTIDADIQYQAQVALAETVERWKAKSGSVVVMDAKTGAILALASVPDFDPNRYWEADPQALRCRPITDRYEPGSTVKAVTAAATIEKGLAKPDTVFRLPPTLKIGDRTIHEAHPRGTVDWTLAQIVTNSSNVGAVKLGMLLGPQGMYEYLDKFGLTERSAVDFPGEAMPSVPKPKDWSATSIGNIPFGQGLAVTPLQLARAIAAIGNGGYLVTPHVLQELPDSPTTKLEWPTRRAISEKTAAQMREVLKAVVTEGTGKGAAVQGYTVAGKTGTAQKARTDGVRGYAKGKYVASFSGFLPADDPAVVIVVTVDEPQGAIYGGTVAAPAFSRIGAFCMAHLGIPPRMPTVGDATSSNESSATTATASSQDTGR